MSIADTAWAFGVFTASAVISAIAGFGFGLLSVPLVAMRVDAHRAVVLSALLGLGITCYQAWIWRHFANRAIALRTMVAAAVGMPLGLWVYTSISAHGLRIALGVATLLAVALLVRGLDLSDAGPGVDVTTGFLSGVLNTSLSTNGPPLVVGLQARRLAVDEFRGTLATIFALSNVISVSLFAIRGHVRAGDLRATALTLPATFVGLWVGGLIRPRVPAERFRQLVLVLLTITGALSLSSA